VEGSAVPPYGCHDSYSPGLLSQTHLYLCLFYKLTNAREQFHLFAESLERTK
jgi:hypothetical protein